MGLDAAAKAAVARVRDASGGNGHPYCEHDFNVHRWIVAWQDEDDAAKSLRRHLNIRSIMPLPPATDEESERMESWAPCAILGRNRDDDNKVLLIEQNGRIDIAGLVDNMRLTSFMRNKFRMMESLQQRVQKEEERTGRQSGGVLVMDLQGLSFSPSLLSVLAGPYRIMWGTLFDQYPQLIQQIIIVNAPQFVNLLYQTCIPFIPNDYKEKIIISSGDASKHLLKHIDASCLPKEYGGCGEEAGYELCLELQNPVSPVPKCSPLDVPLQSVSIAAGAFTVEKYSWQRGDRLEFYLKTDQEFTYWIFHSAIDTPEQSRWTEVYAGCERPALKQIDRWTWTVPEDGFYYIRYGNEKAWLFSVTVKTLIYRLSGDDDKQAVKPVETYQI